MESKPGSSNQVDLAKLLKGYRLESQVPGAASGTGIAPLERAGRCLDPIWGKEAVLFLAALAGVGVVVLACFRIATNPNSSPDDKKWATSILASIVSGVVGYLIRGKQGK